MLALSYVANHHGVDETSRDAGFFRSSERPGNLPALSAMKPAFQVRQTFGVGGEDRREGIAMTPEAQLKGFIDKFDPEHRSVIRAARTLLRRRFPNACELVYDNYNFFVIGYSPTERPSDCIVSLTGGASGIGLCFIRGATLRDPKKRIRGSGNQTRFIRLPTADVLSDPDVEALLAAAIAQARTPLRAEGRGKLIIRSVSPKRRPRRR